MQSDQSRQNGLVITSSVLVAISILVVAARLAIRVCWIRNSGWDDYSIVAALLFDVGYLAEILVAKANRVGFPMATLTPQQRTNFLKDTLAIEATYYAAVAFVKISILAMYLRFLLSPTPRFLCKATIVFHAVFFLVCVAVTLGQCRPFHKAYDATLTVPGHCINSTVFFYFTSGVNIITDIWIFALPVKTLKGISRPKKEKATLIVIFGVGAFATITSIIRLHSIYTYTLAKDPFRDGLRVNLWSMIEVNVGIMCASVPALKPLFTPDRLRQARRGSSKQTSGYKFHSSERSGFGTGGGGGGGSGGGSGIGNASKSDEQLYRGYDLDPMPPPSGAPSSAGGSQFHVDAGGHERGDSGGV